MDAAQDETVEELPVSEAARVSRPTVVAHVQCGAAPTAAEMDVVDGQSVLAMWMKECADGGWWWKRRGGWEEGE